MGLRLHLEEEQEAKGFGIAMGRNNLVNPGRRPRLPGHTEMLSQRLCDTRFHLEEGTIVKNTALENVFPLIDR